MEKEKLYQLKSDASKINPILNIGKNAEATRSTLIDVRGRTVVLYR